MSVFFNSSSLGLFHAGTFKVGKVDTLFLLAALKKILRLCSCMFIIKKMILERSNQYERNS